MTTARSSRKSASKIPAGSVRKRPARRGATPKLLVQFRSSESLHAVSRATVRKMADVLGLNETETTLYALARLRDQLLPAYEPDDGEVSDEVLEAIRRMVPQDDYKPTRSLFKGV